MELSPELQSKLDLIAKLPRKARFAILGGIEPDERIVVTGAKLLSDGELVKIIP